MVKKANFDVDVVIDMYRNKNMTAKSIGQHFGIGEKTMAKHIRNLNIIRLYNDPEWLKEQHFGFKLNLREIGKLANCSHETVSRSMKNLGIKPDLSISNSKYKQNGEYFEHIDTQEKAYWLGFIMADGHVSPRFNRLSIGLKRSDKEHLQKFLYDINSDRVVEDYEVTLPTSVVKMSRIIITSRDFIKPLLDLGFTNQKSLKEFIPEIPSNLVRHFIRGYFDGDGSLYFKEKPRKRRKVSILGGQEYLQNLKKEIQDREDILCSVKNKNKDLFYLNIDDNHCSLFMDWIYFNSKIHLNRKYEKYLELKELFND